jgi:hypothetical protein
MFWDSVTPPYIFTPQTITPSHSHIPIPRKPPQTLKTPSEKYHEKPSKSRNGANPDSKKTILKYCTQKPTLTLIPKKSHKGNKFSQVSKGNPQIAKNKAIRKSSKSRKRLPTHIKEIIAEIPQFRNQTTQENIVKNQRKLRKCQNITT